MAGYSLRAVARHVLGAASLTQIVGKYRLARTPWINHSWHATFYINSRGLTTSLVPDRSGGVEICFDLLAHAVIGSATDGRTAQFSLGPMSVADFHRRFRDLVGSLGGSPEFDGRPNEVPDPIPFVEDRAARPYASDAVTRFFRALVAVDQVLKRFRTGYLGKVSPVHLFWGSFDLAVTRFSGRGAPRHPGGIPALPDAVTREAYSHEVSSAGFWPGEAASIFPRSIPMRIRRRTGSPMRGRVRMRLTSISGWASSCCLMTPCGARARRRRRSCHFSAAPIRRRRISAAGIVRHLNVRLAYLGGRGRCDGRLRLGLGKNRWPGGGIGSQRPLPRRAWLDHVVDCAIAACRLGGVQRPSAASIRTVGPAAS